MNAFTSALVFVTVFSVVHVNTMPQRAYPVTTDDFSNQQASFRSNNLDFNRFIRESSSFADAEKLNSERASTNDVETFNSEQFPSTNMNRVSGSRRPSIASLFDSFNTEQTPGTAVDERVPSTDVEKFSPENPPSTFGVDKFTPDFGGVNTFSPEPYPRRFGFDNPFQFMRRMMEHMQQEMEELQKSMEANFKNFGVNGGFNLKNDFDPSNVKNTSFSDTKVEGNNVITTNERHFGTGDRHNGAEFHFKEVRIVPKQQTEIQSTDNGYKPTYTPTNENKDVELIENDQHSVPVIREVPVIRDIPIIPDTPQVLELDVTNDIDSNDEPVRDLSSDIKVNKETEKEYSMGLRKIDPDAEIIDPNNPNINYENNNQFYYYNTEQ